MIAAYSPPPHVQGDEDNRTLLLSLIAQAAIEPVPADWPADQIRVFGQNLWKAIVGAKYGAHWPLVDQVAKHAGAVVVEMQQGERIAASPGSAPDAELPLGYGWPAFYAHMDATAKRPISESRYMQRRKAEWIRRFGPWPLDRLDTAV